MTLQLFIEQVPPAGRFEVDRIVEQVNQCRLHPLAVLVREFAQNSWDARRSDSSAPVRFSVDGFDLGDSQVASLRDDVFVEVEGSGVDGLAKLLRRRSGGLSALVISDWNTIGLGGVLDPRQVDPSGRSAWTSYLHDIGTGQDDAASNGGRYGMGRTSAYGVSEARTIVVYTRTRANGGALESRLIAVSIAGRSRSREGDRRLTGRVWWGRKAGDFAKPLVGAEADRIAERIGFVRRRGEDLGLSVMIIEPKLVEGDGVPASLQSTMSMIAESILWNLWPKYQTKGRPMSFSVTCNGRQIAVADPRDHPVLSHFVELGESVRRWGKNGVAAPRSRRGVVIKPILHHSTVVGHLALKAFIGPPNRGGASEDRLRQVGAVGSPVNHVLLMRRPELVVDYRGNPGVEAPHNVIGVFIPVNNERVQTAFARAEPVSHDRWSELNIPEEQTEYRSMVRTALRKVDDEFKRFVAQHVNPAGDDGEAQLLKIATRELTASILPPALSRSRKGGKGGGAGGGVNGEAGSVMFVSAVPGHRDGRFITTWRGRWVPRQAGSGERTDGGVGVDIKVEAVPVGQSSNWVPIDPKKPELGRFASDPNLEIKSIDRSMKVKRIAPEIIVVEIPPESGPRDLEFEILRSESIGVDVRVSIGGEA
jgi:hypothetical protein